MTSPYHMLELLLQVDNGRVRFGSIEQKIYSGGDWEFQLRRSRIDSFSREEFDQYCLSVWKEGHFVPCHGQNSKKLGNLLDWQSFNRHIPIYSKDKKGKNYYDFLKKFIALQQTINWHVIHDDGNLYQITCQDPKFYYLFSFGTS